MHTHTHICTDDDVIILNRTAIVLHSNELDLMLFVMVSRFPVVLIPIRNVVAGVV
jgi:hypothetical protein